jgi:hypothetical protein
MAMGKWPGIGDRMRERMKDLKDLGYWKNDRPNVLRFSLEKQYVPMYIYKWLDDTVPSRENLERLAADLQTNAAWLLFGDQAGVSKAPIPPRKRGGQKLGCLVAVGGITLGLLVPPTAWGPSRASAQNTPIGSVATAENVRGIMSSRRRRLGRCQSFRELTDQAA